MNDRMSNHNKSSIEVDKCSLYYYIKYQISYLDRLCWDCDVKV